MPNLTKSQSEALKWLTERNGGGCFDKHGVLLAGGELAPFMRITWNALRDLGLVEMYGAGRGRCRVVATAETK